MRSRSPRLRERAAFPLGASGIRPVEHRALVPLVNDVIDRDLASAVV